MPFVWHDGEVGLPVISVDLGTLSVYSRDGLLLGDRRFSRAIAKRRLRRISDMTADNFSGVPIYCQPDPRLVAFVVDK